jgi:hypothetical protein
MDFFRRVASLTRTVRSRSPFGVGDYRDVKSWAPAILSLFVLGMGLYTAAATALIVHRTYSGVIFWDQWDYVDVALHSHGWPSLSRLWAPFVVSRLVVGRLAGFVDLRFFGGRNVSLLIELCLVPVCLALVLIWMIRRSGQLRGAALATAAGFIAFCALCPVQIEDFTFPIEVDFVFAGLAAVTSFAGAVLHSSRVAAGDRRWMSGPLALSLFAAVLAECSRMHGLLVWPILVVLGFSLRFPRQTRILIGGFGTVAVAIYFWGSYSPGGELTNPIAIGGYVITYFATSWDSLLAPRSAGVGISEFLTILAIVIAVTTIVRHLCLRRSTPDLLRTFLAAIMLFTLSTAVITSLGRLNFGVAQAASSRYQCVALLFWAAVATLILAWAAGRHPRNLVLAGVQAGLLVLMVASAGRFNSYERIAAGLQIRIGRAYVAVTRNPADQAAAGALNPAVAMVPVWCAYLRSHNLGPDPRELEAGLPRVSGPAPIPNWAGYKVVPTDGCLGYLDGLEPGVQEPGVVVATGWAWDREARKPPRKIVFALPDGRVVGFGEMRIPREDVGAVNKNVTNINTGWEGEATAAPGSKLRAFAVLEDTTSMCPLPNEVIVPYLRAPGTPPTEIGFVDEAGDSKRAETVSTAGILLVYGWAADTAKGAPVDRVMVYVDGISAGAATLGQVRRDVENYYNRNDYSNSGWNFKMSASLLSPGKHTVTATASGPSGTAQLAPSKTITIAVATGGGQR